MARMTAIDQALPPADGISCFNKLYLEVTKSVLAAVGQTTFADPGFLTRLDVAFANLFFAALSAFEAGSPDTPHAWSPLFEARASSVIAPIQFALAGMNAHINRDLPVALVDIFAAAGGAPSEESAAVRRLRTGQRSPRRDRETGQGPLPRRPRAQARRRVPRCRRRGGDLERRSRAPGGLDQRRGPVAPAQRRSDRAHLPGDAGSQRRVRLARPPHLDGNALGPELIEQRDRGVAPPPGSARPSREGGASRRDRRITHHQPSPFVA